jgi:hypothetical protein
MKPSQVYRFATTAAFVAMSSLASAETWSDKPVGTLSSSYQPSDCIYFTLIGVSQADPAVSGPWFSMPRSQHGAKEGYAMLLSSKLTGQPVSVSTGGASATCGFASVYQIWMQ